MKDTLTVNGYLGLVEAATVLQIHPQSAWRLVKAGDLPARKVHGKWLIEQAALQQFKTGYSGMTGRRQIRRLI